MVKRNMSLIVSNNFLTYLADSIFDLAIAWYVYQLTGSAFFTATTTAISMTTNILVGPMIGVFIDRTEPKTSMQIGYAIMILVGIILGGTYFFNVDGLLAVIYIALTLHNICMIFIGPAQSKLLPRIVGEQRIVKVKGYLSSTTQTSDLIGQSIGGVVISVIGFVGVMLTHSAVYLLASILLMFVINISLRKSESVPHSKPTVWSDLKGGFKILKQEKTILKIILLAIAANVSMIGGSLLVVLVSDQYNVNATYYGLMNASAAGFGILIGLFANKLVNLAKPYMMFAISLVLAGIGFVGMGLTANYYIGVVFFLVVTGATTLMNIIFGSLLIILVKDEFRGRVNTLLGAFSPILIPPIVLLGGYVADIYEVGYLFIFSGFWLMLVGVIPFIDRDIRSIDHLPNEG
ncbi:MFS transporter [Filobacillus milosensis]|uniref:MFS transporter n=1 Tax=Filobacillus milosensis TaxID=94137 RepID=A0A4Y8IQJ9_9BACI|nr:MFS transporter [Filobacillus milosensis]TFB22810.1 MFS transporter [Filobacillus milosensis]